MQDTNIKGSGNSRTLASVPNFLTLYPTYEDFAQALIKRELPIDLGPLNPAGLNVRGTDLNKETLLKDATAALYGLGADAIPDDILKAIRPKLDTALKKGNFEHGTFLYPSNSGTSTRTLTFSFVPRIVLMAYERASKEIFMWLFINPQKYGVRFYFSGDSSIITSKERSALTWSGNQLIIDSFYQEGINPHYYFSIG